MKPYIYKLSSVSSLLLFAISYFTSVNAASFDCKKASSKTEIAICKNKSLSSLDTELATAYKKLKNKSSSEVKNILIKSQRKWIKERNKYSGRSDLINFYKARIHALKTPEMKYIAKYKKDHNKIKYHVSSGLPSEVLPVSFDAFTKDLIIKKFFKNGPELYGDRFAGYTMNDYSSEVMFELNPDENHVFYLSVATHDNGRPMKSFPIAAFKIKNDGSYEFTN